MASLIVSEVPSGATTSVQLQKYLLDASDLGPGWSSVPVVRPWVNRSTDCITPLAPAKRYTKAIAAAASPSVALVLTDTLIIGGKSMTAIYNDTVQRYADCRLIRINVDGISATGSGRAFPMHLDGVESRAFQFKLHLRAKLTSVGVQLVRFDRGTTKTLIENDVFLAVAYLTAYGFIGTVTLIVPSAFNSAATRSLLTADANFAIAKLNLAATTGGATVGIH